MCVQAELTKPPSNPSPLLSTPVLPSTCVVTALTSSTSSRVSQRLKCSWKRTAGSACPASGTAQSPQVSAAPQARAWPPCSELQNRGTEHSAPHMLLSPPALLMYTHGSLTEERGGCSHSICIPFYAKKDKWRLIQRTDLKNALCYLDKCNLPRELL